MQSRGYVLIGLVLIVAGLIFLFGAIFHVDVGPFCWAFGLILLGGWLILRPQMVGPEMTVHQKLIGDFHRDGVWQVADEEIWLGIGDVDLDMTQAEVPIGETKIRIFAFVSGIDVLIPETVGVSVSSSSIAIDSQVLGREQDGILAPVRVISDGYETVERKVRLETTFLAGDIKVRRI